MALNHNINAIISLNPHALSVADSLDQQLAAATGANRSLLFKKMRLFCIPVLLKDNFDTVDMPTTGGSLALAASQPIVDAPSVAAFRRAGAVILGKANLHELALEGLSVSSLGGQVINPYDFTRTPGGSSGGSGAAIAASFAILATGTDTVNSMRSPASANSLFSIRPSGGLVTRTGIIPISSVQDVPGPFARNVKDLATALTVMAQFGPDPQDSNSHDPQDNSTLLVPSTARHIDYTINLSCGTLKGVRIGVLSTFFNRTEGPETTPVNQAMDAMMSRLEAAGAVLIPINETIYNNTTLAQLDTQVYEYRRLMDAYLSRPTLSGSHPTSLKDLYNTNANGTEGQFLVIPGQYPFVNRSLNTSTETLLTQETANLAKIANLTSTLAITFAKNNVSAIIYPEQKNLVVPLGSPSQSGRNGILAALTGSPVVTVPAGFSAPSEDAPVGVPIGMEILGKQFSDEFLLQLAFQVEGLGDVRRTPVWARERVGTGDFEKVPVVRPNVGNIPEVYPVGVLG